MRKKKIRTPEEARADGYRRGMEGQPKTVCPFDYPDSLHEHWLDGYSDGRDVFERISEEQLRGDPSNWEFDAMILLLIFLGTCFVIYKICT